MCLVDKGPVNKDSKKRADIKAIFHADKNRGKNSYSHLLCVRMSSKNYVGGNVLMKDWMFQHLSH
jgi:ABC-type sulfate transport system substrate-binding protein